MSRQIKERFHILTVAILLVASFLVGFGNSSLEEVRADKGSEGGFHLKKYVDVSEIKEATGQKEDTTDPLNILYGKEAVAGVVYEIYRTHDYIDGKLVEISNGQIQILQNGEKYVTDSNGEINIEGLPLGQYMFREVSAPEGIQINDSQYYFALPYSLVGKTELLYEVYVYPKNNRLTGSLSFKKVGDNGTDGLKNVVFDVYYENGTLVKDANGDILSVTTRLSGIATVEDLQVGKYYLVETQNPNPDYVVNSKTKYWFELYIDNDEMKSRSFYTDASMNNKTTDANGVELAEGTIINYKTPTQIVGNNQGKSGNSAVKTGDNKDLIMYGIGILCSGMAVIVIISKKIKSKNA